MFYGVAEEEECWPAGAEDALSVCVLTLSVYLSLPHTHPPSLPPSLLPGSVRAGW